MKNVKTIIFDLGGVLLNINYQKTIEKFQELGIKNAQKLYSQKKQDDLFNRFETGKINEFEFLSTLKKETRSANLEDIKRAWNAMLLDFPKKRIELLEVLNKKYCLFLLSNTNATHIHEFKKKIGIELYAKFSNLFKKVYYSHEIGMRKPNQEIFQLILNENKLNPKKVLFIDDSIQHIKGAEKLGITTHHLENNKITKLFPHIIQ